MSDSARTASDDPSSSLYNATVAGREEINPQLLTMRVQPDGDLFEFKPGQFTVLGMLGREPRIPEAETEEILPASDKLIRRAYSIASSSVERGYLEFYLALVTSGQLTPRLFAAPYGGRLFLGRKASGLFTLDRVAAEKEVILIATGTGLAPYMSMLRTLLMNDAERKFVVLHGARHSWDLGYRGELESLARIRPNLTYVPAITHPERDPHFQGRSGRIQALVEAGIIGESSGLPLDPTRVEVLLCGNPGMIDAVKALLQARGFVPDQGKQSGTIHAEEYW